MLGFFIFEKMRNFKNEILISPGERKWYEILLASIFYTVFAYLFFTTIYNLISKNDLGLLISDFYHLIFASGFLISMGLNFSMVKDVFINVKDQYLISRYRVGSFSYDVKSKLPNLEYVSIFKNAKDEFEANLWYGKNNHYQMYTFESFEEALDFGKIIAHKFDLDILDATEKGNFKWLE